MKILFNMNLLWIYYKILLFEIMNLNFIFYELINYILEINCNNKIFLFDSIYKCLKILLLGKKRVILVQNWVFLEILWMINYHMIIKNYQKSINITIMIIEDDLNEIGIEGDKS